MEKRIKGYPWPSQNPGPWAGVWLESTGWRDLAPEISDKKPNYFCVHIVVKGRVRLQTKNDVDVVLEKGDMLSTWPKIGLRISAEPPCKGDEVLLEWVRLKGPLARNFMHLMGTTEDRPWGRVAHMQKSRNLIQTIQKLTEEFPDDAELKAVTLLHQLAGALSTSGHASPGERAPAERIREAMEQHLSSGMNVADFAKAFRTSQSNLFLLFKKTFGKSPIQVLTEIRIGRAKELLKETGLSVSEIADSCGYQDPLYFSRQFRKQTGKSPRAYRTTKS